MTTLLHQNLLSEAEIVELSSYMSSLPPNDFSQEFCYMIQTREFLCLQLNFPVAILYRIKNYVCLHCKFEVNPQAEANRCNSVNERLFSALQQQKTSPLLACF